MADISLTIVQTLTAFISFLTCMVLTFLILRKDISFLLNRLFASAIFMMGMTTFFLVLSNLPVILWQVDGPMLFLQAAYQSAIFAFFLFNLAAIFLIYGKQGLYSIRTGMFLVIGTIPTIYVIWFTTPFSRVALGDVVSTSLFKIIVFGFLVLSYLITLILFLLIYNTVEAEVKRNLQIFLAGWLIGGLAMVSIALGDFLRILDILGQVFLTFSVIIMYFSFGQQIKESNESVA